MSTTPEIGKYCSTRGFKTNFHDMGQGSPILFIHGSGPGVTAWANWRGVLPELSQTYRVIAPDMVGFGYTEVPANADLTLDTWLGQLTELLERLELPRVHIVGNSFGGALALHFARRHPEKVDGLILMGAVSCGFPLTDGLDEVWGYTPSLEGMRSLMNVFAFNKHLINDDLVQLRYEASMQRGMDKVYESLFPAPRQRWVDMLAHSPEDLASIQTPTLLVHGRDDQVIPLSASIKALSLMPNADLLAFGNCGHWTQIEKRDAFVRAVKGFVN